MGFWRFLAEPCTGVGHNIGHPRPLPPQNNVEFSRHGFCWGVLYYAGFFALQHCLGGGGCPILWPTPVYKLIYIFFLEREREPGVYIWVVSYK